MKKGSWKDWKKGLLVAVLVTIAVVLIGFIKRYFWS